MVAMQRRYLVRRAMPWLAASLLIVACATQATAEQLEWCALNQSAVGRSALELGVFDDSLTFSDWMESNPEAYDRACVHAFDADLNATLVP